ncbi:MAG: copper resistance protein B [Phenylobacterium sp.]|uniref:copper resistance protein B n=1 Tax=Phenylobacterium sp. TaxID=1871053 RepID=UPI001A4F08FB|nr:copper resistance protein B [Phenylobacterium sp.]MBL8774201.1 copper resistance protein B [Phenylobacterium sp.]
MNPALILALAAIAVPAAAPAAAQPSDPHAAHRAPAAPADPHAHHRQAPPASPAADPHAHHRSAPPAPAVADPHAGHAAPATPADPHAGHSAHDAHAGHGAQPAPIPSAPAPPVPTDHAADRFFPPADMAAARRLLRREHGVMNWATTRLETFEYRPAGRGDGYAWEGTVSYGGDIDRLVIATEGESEGHGLENAEVQALWSHAIGPYFDLRAGVRHDVEPRRRTYATVGVEGLAPYWFEVGAHAFLSDRGDVTVRLEGSYDLRLTQRLILEPRAEANLAAQDAPALGLAAGVTDLELGLRLRYAVAPEFAPYVGVNWSRKLGETAGRARAAGDDVEDTRLVVGLRAWF